MTGNNLRILAITVDAKNRENMEYVPVKAKAGYRTGYNDPHFIDSLPKFTLPNLPRNATFRMFPTASDSMLPIPEGSDIIAHYMQDWKSIKPDTPCIVILKGDQDFVFKLVTMQVNGTFLLTSLNRNYKPYTLDAADVLEIWQYNKHQTDTFPEQQTDLQEIKKLLVAMKAQLGRKINTASVLLSFYTKPQGTLCRNSNSLLSGLSFVGKEFTGIAVPGDWLLRCRLPAQYHIHFADQYYGKLEKTERGWTWDNARLPVTLAEAVGECVVAWYQ